MTLPPEDPFSIHLLRNSCRSERHRLWYVAVPKAGCTSIKWWFAELAGCRPAVEAALARSDESGLETAVHDLLPEVAPEVAALDLATIGALLADPEYFRFSVVRNPFARAFSAWQSKLLLQEPLQVGPYLGQEFARCDPESPDDLARGFESFLEYLAAEEADRFRDVHWTPQFQLLRPDRVAYALVAKLEEPGTLRRALAARIDGPIGDPLASGRIANRGLVPYSGSLVSERAARLVRELYRDDFRAFGYPGDPPDGARGPTREECLLLGRAIRLVRERHRRIADLRHREARHAGEFAADRAGLEVRLAEQTRTLDRRDAALAEAHATVHARDAALAEAHATVHARDAALAEAHATVRARDAALAEAHAAVHARDAALAETRATVREREETIVRRTAELEARERRIGELEAERTALRDEAERLERDRRATEERARVDATAARARIADLDAKALALTATIGERMREAEESARTLRRVSADTVALKRSLTALERERAEDRDELDRLRSHAAELDRRIEAMRASRSWRVTAPLRSSGDGLRRLLGRLRSRPEATATRDALYRLLRTGFHALPMPAEWRRTIATRAFRRSDWLRNTGNRLASPPRTAAAIEDPLVAAGAAPGRSGARPKALIVEHRIPTPDRTSGSTRLRAIIDLVASSEVAGGWDVTVASHASPKEYHWVLGDPAAELPRYEAELAALGARCIFGPDAIADFLRREGRDCRLVFLSYPEVMHRYAPLARVYAPDALLAYDTVDLHGVRFRREAAAKGDDAELRERADRYDAMESANIECADLTIAITSVEEGEILRRCPTARVAIVPNIHEPRRAAPPFEGREGLLFIGHYLHAPNEDAVIHFVREILPRIERRMGPVPFHMVGSSLTDPVRALASDRVFPVGFVADPVPWFDRCRVFVAPLRFGAGMKGKIGQSMGLGLPVVTTAIGAEGMGLESGIHALVADDPEEFAERTVRLYRDAALWTSLSTGGLDHIARRFSRDAVRAEVDRILTLAGTGRHA